MARYLRLLAVVGLGGLAGCGASLKNAVRESPIAGLTVEVREFTPPDESPRPVLPPEGPSVAQRVVKLLRDSGINARPGGPSDDPADLVIDGQVTLIDRGNRGLRYLGGGTGAARFAVRGRAVRAGGTTLGEFSAARRAGFGLFGGDGDTLLSNCVDAVAHDVAEMVIRGIYEHRQEETAFRANALFHP